MESAFFSVLVYVLLVRTLTVPTLRYMPDKAGDYISAAFYAIILRGNSATEVKKKLRRYYIIIVAGGKKYEIGFSKYHTSRMFKEETDLTLFEYIRRERLLAAVYALRNGNERVLDVALDFMFDSHEGFTRAFANGFGITPKEFSSYPNPDGWLIPYYYLNRNNKKTEEFSMEHKTAVIFTQIMERPARRLILFRSKNAADYFEYCEEVGCGTPEKPAPWDILCGIKNALNEPMGVWLPESMRLEGTGVYAHAVEVPANYSGKIPAGFDVIGLKPCLYLIFQGEPYDDEKYDDAIGALWENIAAFNPKVHGYEWDNEAAPRFQACSYGLERLY